MSVITMKTQEIQIIVEVFKDVSGQQYPTGSVVRTCSSWRGMVQVRFLGSWSTRSANERKKIAVFDYCFRFSYGVQLADISCLVNRNGNSPCRVVMMIASTFLISRRVHRNTIAAVSLSLERGKTIRLSHRQTGGDSLGALAKPMSDRSPAAGI